MLSSLRIGRLFGVPIYLHWTLLLLPLWILYSNLRAPGQELVLHLAVTAAALGCIVLHEFGHILMARFFGISTRDVTLYPIGGVASLERMSEKPWEEFWIALAGPAVNVVIAGLLLLGLGAASLINPALVFNTFGGFTFGGFFAVSVFVANVILVVFNLIPAFPMDGGRVLRSLLAVRMGQLRATRVAVRVGTGMALLMAAGAIYLGTLGIMNPVLFLIAFFIMIVGQRELELLEHRERLRAEELLMGQQAETMPDYFAQAHIPVYKWDDRAGVWVPSGAAVPLPPDR